MNELVCLRQNAPDLAVTGRVVDQARRRLRRSFCASFQTAQYLKSFFMGRSSICRINPSGPARFRAGGQAQAAFAPFFSQANFCITSSTGVSARWLV